MADFAPFVNTKQILAAAQRQKYAVAHVNINNYEWIKAVLQAAQVLSAPIILGVSEGAVKYQSGYQNVRDMVANVIQFDQITIPVVLHLDHGTFEGALKALDVGFSSVMYDGSHSDFAANLANSRQIVAYAKQKGASVEVEVGTIGGEEDGVASCGELADLQQCVAIANLGIDMLAAGIGNVHGIYPSNWRGLDLDLLAQIVQATRVPLVLHGGSGIDDPTIKQAISLGVCKINVNTECQLAFATAIRGYITEAKDLDKTKKGFDPRKLLKPGVEAIKATVEAKINLFGSHQKGSLL